MSQTSLPPSTQANWVPSMDSVTTTASTTTTSWALGEQPLVRVGNGQ